MRPAVARAPMATRVTAVMRLARRSIHEAVSRRAPSAVAVVRPTMVATVATIKAASEPRAAVVPRALAATKTGRIVRSGEAAAPKGISRRASPRALW